jgi:alpha-L-fucosidase 2
MKRPILTLLLLLTILRASSQDYKLWYKNPAREWEEALPLGNGRLGAMVYGGINLECISLNEETIWGFNSKPAYADPNNRYLLDAKRKLIFEGKYKEAKKLQLADLTIPEDKKLPLQAIKGMLTGADTYKPLADLFLNFGSTEIIPSDYRRELSLDKAVSTVTYKVGDVTYKREVFASNPDQVIVIRISADRPKKVNFSSQMTRKTDIKDDTYRYDPGVEPRFFNEVGTYPTIIKNLGAGYFSFSGQTFPKGVKFNAHFKLKLKGGKSTSIPSGFRVEDADEAIIYITAATDFYGTDPNLEAKKYMDKVAAKPYDDLLSAHLKDYQNLYRSVDFELDKNNYMATLPTDKRVLAYQLGVKDTRVKKGTPRDNDLYAIYYQFGRYLMIANSRKGTLPPALQGLWNNSLLPPWRGHHTTDINVQMNYWPAEVANLSESHEVLLDFLSKHIATAKDATNKTYGTRGLVIFGMTQWGFPSSFNEGFLDFAGWAAQHYWNHYEYTLNKDFLRNQAYPFMKEAALFYLDNLVEYPGRGYLVAGPETSPENHFISPQDNNTLVDLSMGTTMSRAIIYELFTNYIKASEILGVDEDLRKDFIKSRSKLSPYQIGKYGQLQEWLEDFEENDLGHRHLSHLYPIYPGTEITKTNNPILFEAARKSMLRRLENGSGWTGWSRAWMICLAARFKDADLAQQQLESMIAQTTYYNLFDTHPRNAGNTSCFQIDGNMGAVAGISEMLMQSHNGYIDILPAKPANWGNGHVKGLIARGGFKIDIEWKLGELTSVRVESQLGGKCTIKSGDKIITLETQRGDIFNFNADLVII